MKQWKKWLFHNSQRKLEVSTGGRWFLAFTIVLGVVAINSGNNVVYLLESLLLSSLIFSGILSELTLTRIKFTRQIRQAAAGEQAGDILVLQNTGWLPLYCVELGEWKNGKFTALAFVLQIPGHSELKIKSHQIVELRGRHQWDSLALGTSFPFGFARKLRIIPLKGERIVWPGRAEGALPVAVSKEGEWEPSEGEIEEIQPWEDLSRVHWPSTARAGIYLSRPRRKISDADEVVLQLGMAGEAREKRIQIAANRLRGRSKSLLIQGEGPTRRIDGSWRALDALALLPKDPG